MPAGAPGGSKMDQEKKIIQVDIPGSRSKFEYWIKERGGVQVWINVNLSDPGAGEIFTPAKELTGADYPKPKWSVTRGEVITDINRFKFVKDWVEKKRFKVKVRLSSNGTMLKCTEVSSRRIWKELEKLPPGATYHFDYENAEAVISVPIYE